MRDIFVVMKFTILDMLRRKSYIISTIVILLLIVVGFNIPKIISNVSSDNNKERILIIDEENIFANNLSILDSLGLNYEFSYDNLEEEKIKEQIDNDTIDSALIISKDDNMINMRYLVENVLFIDSIPEDLIDSLSTIYTKMQINKLNLTKEEEESLMPHFNYNIEQVSQEVNGNVIVMMLLSIVLFYAVYFCAYQISSSITTEKTSKIIETLVTSTSPKNIVLGKTIGIGITGLLQMVLILLTAVISAKCFLAPNLLSMLVDIKSINLSLGIFIIIYFLLGYFTYALLYALTGSTVAKPEDVQSANTPVAIITVLGFYLAYFTMMDPLSELGKFTALFPISSPFCMPFCIMMGIASPKDIILSLTILVITILIIAKLAIKIYSNAILNYGSKMSLGEIFRMSKNK